MSRPRRIVPNATQLVTRRVTHRLFLLRPDKHTTSIINYCLAEAAKRHGIDLICWLFMSNHYHAVVNDPRGSLPAFFAHFHKMISKALNHRWQREENFWSSAETNVTLLPTQDDVLRKVVYVLTNPVKANLVDSVAMWPGASSWSYMSGKPRSHARPSGYFNKKTSTMPTSAKLVARPPRATILGERGYRMETWAKRVRAEVLAKEKELRAIRKRDRITLPKLSALRTQDPNKSPSTPSKRGKHQPTIACHNKTVRKSELATLSEFRRQYDKVRRDYANGNRRVCFPVGTYRMRLLGAPCKSDPD